MRRRLGIPEEPRNQDGPKRLHRAKPPPPPPPPPTPNPAGASALAEPLAGKGKRKAFPPSWPLEEAGGMGGGRGGGEAEADVEPEASG
jgi:hypothetical protein